MGYILSLSCTGAFQVVKSTNYYFPTKKLEVYDFRGGQVRLPRFLPVTLQPRGLTLPKDRAE
jgi:hypothetical protein